MTMEQRDIVAIWCRTNGYGQQDFNALCDSVESILSDHPQSDIATVLESIRPDHCILHDSEYLDYLDYLALAFLP